MTPMCGRTRRLRASAISVDELRDALLELAKHGRVLVLLDACHSGATTMAGEALTNNQDALKGALAAANITVLTSSSGSESSREDEKWGHGAFTRALLDALGDPMADPSHIGLISSNSLAVYMHQHVPGSDRSPADAGDGGAVRKHGVRPGALTRPNPRWTGPRRGCRPCRDRAT